MKSMRPLPSARARLQGACRIPTLHTRHAGWAKASSITANATAMARMHNRRHVTESPRPPTSNDCGVVGWSASSSWRSISAPRMDIKNKTATLRCYPAVLGTSNKVRRTWLERVVIVVRPRSWTRLYPSALRRDDILLFTICVDGARMVHRWQKWRHLCGREAWPKQERSYPTPKR